MEVKNSTIISVKELNDVLTYLEKNPNIKEITVHFLNPIERVDIVFIAGLLLYHIQNRVKFNITHSSEINTDHGFEIRQYLKQFDQLYDIKWFNVFELPSEFRPTDETDVVSRAFAPIMLINENTFEQLFRKGNKQSSNPFMQIHEKYQKIAFDENPTGKEYLSSPDNLFKKIIVEEAPIYAFIYIILYSKLKPFKGVTVTEKAFEDSKKVAIERAEEIWGFTKEYISGLQELAKNITEHSDTKTGILSIRAYDGPNTGDTVEKVLETHVFDFGKTGIISNLIESTEKNISKSKAYADDLLVLKDPLQDYRLENFIKPKDKNKLNQQIYRDLAHYGLMKFFHLIERNQGIVECASNSRNHIRDAYFNYDNIKGKTLAIGTSYYFQLPFKPDLFKATESENRSDEMQGTPETILGLTHLLNNALPKNIQIIQKINNREDESELIKLINNSITKKDQEYITFDMEGISLSSSSLLRLCAYLSQNYGETIIIYNLNYDLYREMLADNFTYYKNIRHIITPMPFWFKDKGILFYTFVDGKSFHFADILYGGNVKQFYSINHIISLTYPNTVTITSKDLKLVDNFSIPKCLHPYFYQSSLLPFDLILEKEGNKLFLNNLRTLLEQDLIKKNNDGQ